MSSLTMFAEWMKQTTKLSDSSIYKYSSAIKIVSQDMMSIGIISKPLTDMGKTELDIVLPIILNNNEFIAKNLRGNHMYSNGLKQFRSWRAITLEEDLGYTIIVENIKADKTISVTEREAIIKSRIGQGEFRNKLIRKYNSSCIITGINIPTLLIASHIKPWAASNNNEKLSEENGLLLSASYDRLFDSGLISFENTGEVLISKYIDNFNRSKLNLNSGSKIDISFSFEMKHNLEYHRDIVFLK